MKRSVLLNWLPFTNQATGAAKRAFELHRRLSGQFDFTAVVADDFSTNSVPEVKLALLKSGRNAAVRFSEGLPGFWKKHGAADVWVTDTLPVPRFSSDIKTVLTVHDLRFLVNRKYLSLTRYLLLKLSMKAGLNRADVVVTVSSWIADQIVKEYGISGEKLHIIPNSAATLPHSATEENQGGKYLLAVGHLEPRKSVDTLIKAFSLIRNEWDGDLVIAGTGPQEKELKALVQKLNCDSRVRFAGRVSDSELSSLYAHTACLVCPSVYEGFGMTILEGLASGVTVAASAIPPHMEVAGDAALWFEPGNPQDLYSVLKLFLGGRLSVDSHLRAERVKEFSWDDSAEQLALVYSSI